jgi:RES domain-containing protein
MAEASMELFGARDDPPPPAGDADARPPFIQAGGTLFRCADYDTPVWSRPNTLDGRWHRHAPRLSVQYWSYSPTTAWAEMLRNTGVREPEDVLEMRSRIWAGRIEFTQIANLTDVAWLNWLDLDPEQLIADDRAACQDAAEHLIRCGASGLIAPSAAMPDRLNLVLFRRMIRGDWHETPEGPRALRFPEKVLPCRLIAHGHPPAEIVHDVRYHDSL